MTVKEAYYKYKSAKRAQDYHERTAMRCFKNGFVEMGAAYFDESEYYRQLSMSALVVINDYIMRVNSLGYTQHAWHALKQI